MRRRHFLRYLAALPGVLLSPALVFGGTGIPVPSARRHARTPLIKVIGIGNAGVNVLRRLHAMNPRGVELIFTDTDARALHGTPVRNRLLLGSELTGGRGAGHDPSLGHDVAILERRTINWVITGADMVIIIAVLGGGTGTGVAPVIAAIAQERGIPVTVVVSLPPPFASKRFMMNAEHGLAQLSQITDDLHVFPFESVLPRNYGKMRLIELFQRVDAVLCDTALRECSKAV